VPALKQVSDQASSRRCDEPHGARRRAHILRNKFCWASSLWRSKVTPTLGVGVSWCWRT